MAISIAPTWRAAKRIRARQGGVTDPMMNSVAAGLIAFAYVACIVLIVRRGRPDETAGEE